jgi:diguanylate cyclase (GGDEF)-like protein/PAS domain S-box-containing protein
VPAPGGRDDSARLLQMLEKYSASGAWVLDLRHWRLEMSSELAALLERTIGACDTDQGLLKLYAPECRERMEACMEACAAYGEPFDEEAQIIGSSGARLWVRAIGKPLLDADGGVRKIHGLLQDLTERKNAEQATQLITMRLSTTLASIDEAFATVDHQGCFTYLNRETENLLARSAGELLGQPFWEAFDKQVTGRLQREIRLALASDERVEFEEHSAGLERWLEVRAYPFEHGLAIYLRDVSERRRSQEQLLLLETSIAKLNDIVMITEAGPLDHPGPRIVFVNDAFERQTGYSRAEAIGRTPRLLHGPHTQRAELAKIRAALEAAQTVRTELLSYKKDGEAFWLEMEIVPVDHASRGLTHWVIVARDITQRKAAEDEIEHLAFYDTLTQLPNRKLLMDRLEAALSSSEAAGASPSGALMFIDLDHFKVLNDTLGHSKGDLLLQQVAARLSGCVRASDTVARLGGDEFVVMLESLDTDPDAARHKTQLVGDKILAALSEPYDLAGFQHHSTCSIGITSFGRRDEKIGDLLKQADLAMYQAKAAGRNAVCFFDPAMQAMASANAAINSELREALRAQQFVLHYQPQVGLGGKMLGAEALVRWRHPERGLVMPDAFIAQAEESGLILPLGEWVIHSACSQLAEWALQPQTREFSMAVNVSVRQFRDPDFVDMVIRIINDTGIVASRLKLELTETLLASGMEITIAKMGKLKRQGVTLSIDDFGMGYSALSYLKHLPLDQLKIDRSFVQDILHDPNDAAIARTIIGLAQSLGLGVMAEGVETEAQRALLERFGCECYQGYLFSKPVPIEELGAFVSSRPVPLGAV